MTTIQKLKDLHTNKNINYTFIANYINVSRQTLYRFMLPADNKEHRKLKKNKLVALEELLDKLYKL